MVRVQVRDAATPLMQEAVREPPTERGQECTKRKEVDEYHIRNELQKAEEATTTESEEPADNCEDERVEEHQQERRVVPGRLLLGVAVIAGRAVDSLRVDAELEHLPDAVVAVHLTEAEHPARVLGKLSLPSVLDTKDGGVASEKIRGQGGGLGLWATTIEI